MSSKDTKRVLFNNNNILQTKATAKNQILCNHQKRIFVFLIHCFFYQRNLKLCYVFCSFLNFFYLSMLACVMKYFIVFLLKKLECYVVCSFFEFLLSIHVTMCHEVVHKIKHLSAFFNRHQNPLLISLYYLSFTTCHISSSEIFCENYCELLVVIVPYLKTLAQGQINSVEINPIQSNPMHMGQLTSMHTWSLAFIDFLQFYSLIESM